MPSSLFLMSSRQRGRNYGELSTGHDFLSARGSGDRGGGRWGGGGSLLTRQRRDQELKQQLKFSSFILWEGALFNLQRSSTALQFSEGRMVSCSIIGVFSSLISRLNK